MPLEDTLAQTEARMKKAIDALKHELSTVRTGRAAPSLVENLEVEAYGAATPLVSLAAISAPEPRLIVIQPWDRDRSLIKAIEKAILASDLGLAPSNDGTVIRLNIPALTEERRRDLVKNVHKKIEDGRVEVRTLRRHAHDELRAKEKSSGVTTDEVKRIEAQLQKLTDRYILTCDEIGQAKEKEILAV
jgi:ribosome recycling factor